MRIVILFLFLTISVHAYTNNDVEIANNLAEGEIIVEHATNPDKYRLDETITRQETIGVALKLRGIPLGDYRCKGYFSDVFFLSHETDAWVCRAVEMAADKGIISRENAQARPRDTITKSEALALMWKAAHMTIERKNTDDLFYNENKTAAQEWQQHLLTTAMKSGIIAPKKEISSGKTYLFWDHNAPATRKEIFALIWQLVEIKKASAQMYTLSFSGEVQYKPSETRIMSTNEDLIALLGSGKMEDAVTLIHPRPVHYRSEGNTLFIMQKSDIWGKFVYSSISAFSGKVLQKISSYSVYEKALLAMLQKFNIPSEKDFYALPYGDLWEKTRDFVEQFALDEFINARIVLPSDNT